MTIRNGEELQKNQPHRQKMVREEGEFGDLMVPGNYNCSFCATSGHFKIFFREHWCLWKT